MPQIYPFVQSRLHPLALGKTTPVPNHDFYVPSFALLVCLSPQPKAQPPGGTAPFFCHSGGGWTEKERERRGGGGRCPPPGLPRDGAAAPELGGAAAACDEEVAEDADVARDLDPHEPLQPLRSCRMGGGRGFGAGEPEQWGWWVRGVATHDLDRSKCKCHDLMNCGAGRLHCGGAPLSQTNTRRLPQWI